MNPNLDRAHRAVARLIDVSTRVVATLDVAAWHVHGEPVPPAQAHCATYEPFAVGGRWGGAWDTTWFRLRGIVPDKGRVRIAFGPTTGVIGFCAEGLVYQHGRALQGIAPLHTMVRVAPGETELFVEAAANPTQPLDRRPASRLDPDFAGEPIYTLALADIVTIDDSIEAFAHDLRVLAELASIDAAGTLDGVLGNVLDAIDAGDEDSARVLARSALASAASLTAAPHRTIATGHAHIDTAWLWPIREARRKCARTFATALRLMERYSEYTFTCSQAQHYAWIKQDHPHLFEAIRERVAQGRWIPAGGMWVEPDCNMPSGESLVRQLLWGQRWFEREFGVRSTEAWLPDGFGFTGALPQILRQAGITRFVTQKLSINDTTKFGHHSFWWEGLDGSRVLAHFPPADTYNGSFRMAQIAHGERSFREHAVSSASLYIYGWGDGGGGATEEMFETAARVSHVELGAPRDYFAIADSEASEYPVWRGELYFQAHRGTYTSHAALKRANRSTEAALREAELWSVAAGTHPDLEEAWRLLLLNQFHDILPGSSIRRVFEEALADLDLARHIATSAAEEARAALVARIDTSAFARPAVVFSSASTRRGEIPALGWTVTDRDNRGAVAAATAHGIENDVLSVKWDVHGVLTSVVDKRTGRETLAGRGNLFQLLRDQPKKWDAWEIDAADMHSGVDCIELESIEVLDGAVRMTRPIGERSRVSQRISLDGEIVEFATEIDWHENDRLLKVAFDANVTSDTAAFETAFGFVERPTHRRTPDDAAQFEVPAHRWAAMTEPGLTVALVNDGRHGHDVLGSRMRLSLVRAPSTPDPQSDRGRHHVRYGWFVASTDLAQSAVAEAAEAFGLPVTVVPTSPHDGDLPSTHTFVSVNSAGVLVSAVKHSDRTGEAIVRLYETYGQRQDIDVDGAVAATNLLESERLPVPPSIGGFEIQTLIIRTAPV